MSKESKFVCQLAVTGLLLSSVWISASFAGKPERPPEGKPPVDLEVEPSEPKVAPAARLAALPPQRDSNAVTDASVDSSDAVKLVKEIYAQTQTAKTAKDFSAIVMRCESALEPSMNLNAQHQSDVKGLSLIHI